MKHTKGELKQMQSLPLRSKILMTKQRIQAWYESWKRYEIVNEKTNKSRFVTALEEPPLKEGEYIIGEEAGQVYISFSGGKDSTVLLHLARELYPDIEAVFVNTGLEYPEIQKFVKTFENVTILRPKMRFDEVIKTYGYPMISKAVANCVRGARNGSQSRINLLNGKDCDGSDRRSKFSKLKYKPLVDLREIEFSEQCCDVMKKAPAHEFQKKTGKKPIFATMAEESMLRENGWLQNGCNAFTSKNPQSTPMAFWTNQDILQYIKEYIEHPLKEAWWYINSEYRKKRKKARKVLRSFNYRKTAIASVYGSVEYAENPDQMRIEDFGLECGREQLKTTGCDRTGCIFCGFGCHLEKEPSRFQRLKETHPRQYAYCIGGGEYEYKFYHKHESGEWEEFDISFERENGTPMTEKEIERFAQIHTVGFDGKYEDEMIVKCEKKWKPNKEGLGLGHVFDELNKIYGDDFIIYK